MAAKRPTASSRSDAGQAARRTERGRPKDEALEPEGRLWATLDSLLEGCQIIGPDWRYLYVNDAVVRQGRQSKKDLLGHTMMELYPGIEDTEMFAHLRRCMEERIPHRMDNEFTYPDGEKGWFELSIQPVPEGVFILSLDITERKRAGMELLESEARYRSLFEKSADGLALVIDGKIELINPRMQEIAGHAQEEVVGRSPEELVVPEERERVGTRVRELSAGGPERPAQYRIRRKNGDLVPVEVISRGIDYHGRNAILSTLRDVSERVRAEEALSESEERWRSLVENAPDFIMTVDREGLIQFINRTVLGLSREGVLGTSIYDYVAPDYRQKVQSSLERVFQAGEPESYEVRLVEDMGSAWYSSHIGPVKRDGQVAAATIVSADITDRKRVEEELRESEERFRSLSKVSFEGIAIHEDGLIMDANSAFAALAGYDRSEVIGMHALDFTAPEFRDAVTENIRTGAGEPYEVMALKRDGTQFPAELRGGTVPMEGRRVRVVAVRDLTELRNAEAMLQQARDELEGRIERQMVRRNPYGLTFREFTVLHHVATGKADKEIARELGISPLTVQKHVASILAKMNASSRTEAGVRAVREALLD